MMKFTLLANLLMRFTLLANLMMKSNLLATLLLRSNSVPPSPLAKQTREVGFRANTKPFFLGCPDPPVLELERPRCSPPKWRRSCCLPPKWRRTRCSSPWSPTLLPVWLVVSE